MIRLFDVPHAQIEQHLRGGTPVWLSANPVEFHGPHLSLHNDRFLSLGVMADVNQALGQGELLLADDLEVGVGPAPGLGSRFTTYRTMRELVIEAVERLADLGAKRVVLMTFHGDPLHNVALSAGVDALSRRGVKAVAPFNRLLQEMLVLEPQTFERALDHVPEPERSRMLAELQFDFHAGFFETSLSLHYAPQAVSPRYTQLPPCPTIRPARGALAASRLASALGARLLGRELRFAAQGFGWYALEPFPGYTSAPHLATKEAGAVFAAEIVRRFSREVQAVLYEDGESPKPIMAWSGAVTLGGRLV